MCDKTRFQDVSRLLPWPTLQKSGSALQLNLWNLPASGCNSIPCTTSGMGTCRQPGVDVAGVSLWKLDGFPSIFKGFAGNSMKKWIRTGNTHYVNCISMLHWGKQTTFILTWNVMKPFCQAAHLRVDSLQINLPTSMIRSAMLRITFSLEPHWHLGLNSPTI